MVAILDSLTDPSVTRRCPMPRVIHFEIHADDPERAVRFYTSLYGYSGSK
jgi:predicted enzyme related to lactoylglutathione lyase